jgi:hypothetical protein
MKLDADRGIARVAVAGAAGGAAEVLWIGLVAAVLGIDGSRIAQAVTTTVLPSFETSWAAWLGLGIHFLLSLALAAVFAPVVARRLRGAVLVAAAVGALGLVWALNFFVLLPALNPAFTTLLPLQVTLASKLLFGAVMGLVLAHTRADA